VYLLYLDESGNEDNPEDRHFVLAGTAVFERQPHWLTQRLDAIQSRHLPGKPPTPFHATNLRSGKGAWRAVDSAVRAMVLSEIADAICSTPPEHLHLFGSVVEKTDVIHGDEAVRIATQEVLKRFDNFLIREHKRGNTQRGLLVFAEGRFTRRLKVWVREFREMGTEHGLIHNLSDIPFFVSMADSRILQAADYVAHSLFLLYERGDRSLFDAIERRFAREEGDRILGISHRPAGKRGDCRCSACMSYEHPGEAV
jgi:hypothetical protein